MVTRLTGRSDTPTSHPDTTGSSASSVSVSVAKAEQLPQLPDGAFLPPMSLNCGEQHVKERIAARYGRERVLTIGRAAVLTTALHGRAACHY